MPRILVVDDDPMVCMAIEIYLERHSFQVTIADGGEAGLRALEGVAFDLMIVDIFMPHMRGFESIRIFHERAPTIPLIAMSGYAFANLDSPAPDFLRMALELGATRCLRKPFTPVALLTVINECMAEGQSAFYKRRSVEIAIAMEPPAVAQGRWIRRVMREDALIHDGRLDADALLLAKPCRRIELAKMIRAALAPDTIQNRD